ncbi:MAG: glycerate kinase [Bacteroidaceae bacterium]|nr:glycerate kinase [Bacteroidaceae bacterium]
MSTPPTFILCSDSFKGCLSSVAVNAAVCQGVRSVCPEAVVHSLTMSDGGEGFVDAVAACAGGQRVVMTAHDPLGRLVDATYLLLDDGTAVIESAATCGMHLVAPEERNPLRCSSYGLGEMMIEAWRRGCQRMVIGLGGTCTCDAGRGMLRALQSFFESNADALFSDADAFPSGAWQAPCPVMMACDVDAPLFGQHGAARVFAPQKGATPSMVELLEERAIRFAQCSAQCCQRDRSSMPGAGAAGGIGYALMQYLDATQQSGINILLDLYRFDALLHADTIVVTGEGHADRQTLMGKVPYGILQRAMKKSADTWLLAGRIDDEALLREAGFGRLLCINDVLAPGDDAMNADTARQNITATMGRAVTTMLQGTKK